MFKIPNFHKMEMTFEDAKSVLLTLNDSLLEGMEHMNAMWEKHCSDDTMFEDDDDFYEHFAVEVNAYNKVFETMKPLFS